MENNLVPYLEAARRAVLSAGFETGVYGDDAFWVVDESNVRKILKTFPRLLVTFYPNSLEVHLDSSSQEYLK